MENQNNTNSTNQNKETTFFEFNAEQIHYSLKKDTKSGEYTFKSNVNYEMKFNNLEELYTSIASSIVKITGAVVESINKQNK